MDGHLRDSDLLFTHMYTHYGVPAIHRCILTAWRDEIC